jgi:hypothetical protein
MLPETVPSAMLPALTLKLKLLFPPSRFVTDPVKPSEVGVLAPNVGTRPAGVTGVALLEDVEDSELTPYEV